MAKQIGWSVESNLLADIDKLLERLIQVTSASGGGGGGTGTVTSVAMSGGTTGLTFSGGPITSSGTFTASGTLAVANGGTGLTSLGTGVNTWLGTPSWINFNSAITGTAPFYSLATGGTLIGVNTLTSNTASQLLYVGTYTTTASAQKYIDFAPTSTLRATTSDTYSIMHIGGSITSGANSQALTGLLIDTTFTNGGGHTGLVNDYLRVGTTTNSPFRINAAGAIAGNTTNTQTVTFNTAGSNLSLSGSGGNAFMLSHASIIGIQVNSTDILYIRPVTNYGFQILQNGSAATSTATQKNSIITNLTVSSWNGSAAVTDFFTTRATHSTSVNQEFFYDIYTGTSASIPSLATMLFRLKNNGDLLLGAGASTTLTPSSRLHVRGAGTTTGSTLLLEASDGTDKFNFIDNGDFQVDKTITAGGTTGDRTINKLAGTINIAAAGTSAVLTNSLITANSVIMLTLRSNDTTAKSAAYVATGGSATIYLNAAATAEVSIGFFIIN